MDISQFVAQSIGQWRSQRSAHHLAFQHFEAVQSVVNISTIDQTDSRVIALCKSYDIDPQLTVSPFHMRWEGESDWDEEAEPIKGETVLVPVPDPSRPNCGRLLREQGYAETMEAAGTYYFTEEGMFVLETSYDRAAAEERIWFVNPKLRFRVSMIKTSGGSGVVTASFASEIKASS
ncbi:MAG: phycobiliprotein lyase [Alkalinema sp. RL_2_19]|nr:phycobiliprotein lyase [Alkalinema sp. RL_2_19]